MAWKKNIVKADLRSYPPYLIMGQAKIGKTQLFRDLVLKNFESEEKGLLVSFSDEEGYLALDKIQVERIVDWDADENAQGERGFVQLVDDLVENKSEYGIEIIGLDTLDKMVEVASKEVYELHRRLKGKYPESMNSALGGFGAGNKKVVDLMLGQIARLRAVGYAIVVLAHTKNKDKVDPVTGEAYEQITNNLISTFYNPIADISQMVVNLVMEREITDGKQIGQKRMMYFVSNGLVDAGGRFNGLPEKMELSADNFMKAFEIGVKNSIIGDNSDKIIEERKIAEEKAIAETSKRVQQEAKEKKQSNEEFEKKKEMFSLFQSQVKDLPGDKLILVKTINTDYNLTADSFKDLNTIPMEVFDKYLDVIKQ